MRIDADRQASEYESSQLRSLIGNVAHDLKTPLQSIAMDMEWLRQSFYRVDSDADAEVSSVQTSIVATEKEEREYHFLPVLKEECSLSPADYDNAGPSSIPRCDTRNLGNPVIPSACLLSHLRDVGFLPGDVYATSSAIARCGDEESSAEAAPGTFHNITNTNTSSRLHTDSPSGSSSNTSAPCSIDALNSTLVPEVAPQQNCKQKKRNTDSTANARQTADRGQERSMDELGRVLDSLDSTVSFMAMAINRCIDFTKVFTTRRCLLFLPNVQKTCQVETLPFRLNLTKNHFSSLSHPQLLRRAPVSRWCLSTRPSTFPKRFACRSA